MASFDMIECVGRAYQAVWYEKAYLLKLAAIPLAVKCIFIIIAAQASDPDNILRTALILLPAYITEGWLLSHWVRTLLTEHRWPLRADDPEAQDRKKLIPRARGILSGTITYTLINLAMAGFFALVFAILPTDLENAENDPVAGFSALLVLVLIFLTFRFVWIYVPMAMNIKPQRYASLTDGLMTTFRMIGLWLVCFVPPILALQLAAAGFAENGETMNIVLLVLKAFLDTLKNILVTAGMAFALAAMMKEHKA